MQVKFITTIPGHPDKEHVVDVGSTDDSLVSLALTHVFDWLDEFGVKWFSGKHDGDVVLRVEGFNNPLSAQVALSRMDQLFKGGLPA